MSRLQSVADNIWVVNAEHCFAGLHIGTRMTVVRLSGGALWLHSPVAIDAALQAEIEALGPVRHIVCPNMFHHMYAAPAAALWPDARRYGPELLRRKRPDLRLDSPLSDTPDREWQDDLQPITIQGSLLFETVFYHAASRSLISSDLVENFHGHDHGFTRWYLRMGGILDKVGWHPLLRLLYVRRAKARASLQRVLALPFERLILAHGEIITQDAHAQLRAGLAWLQV